MTNYPTSLDSFTNPSATSKQGEEVGGRTHSEFHADINDAVETLQAKVGADSSAVTTSHDYKLSEVTSTAKAVSTAGNQTVGGDKTFTGVISATSTQLTTPKITTSINDTNGNEVIETPATGSAVNNIKVINSATGNDPTIEATGDNTNVGIKIKGKGTGKVKLGDAELQIPDTDGTSGQFLQTNGSSVLSWASLQGIAVETTAGATHSLTTDGLKSVFVIAIGNFVSSSSPSDATISILYDGVTKNSVTVSNGSINANEEFPFTLIYTETPAADTANITVSSSAGSVANVDIYVIKF